MVNPPRYKYYPTRPKKLTASFAKAEYQKLLKQLPGAEAAKKPELWIKLFSDWNALQAYIGGEYARVYHAYSKHLDDKKLESTDTYFREQILPIIFEFEHQLVAAFLNTKHQGALLKKFGHQLQNLYESQQKPLDPINTELSIKSGKLSTEYSKRVSAATVTLNDKKMTLEQAGAIVTSPKRAERKAAYLAVVGWFDANRAKNGKLFGQLVRQRDQMGKNLGFDSYVPLAYLSNGRFDYDRQMVEQFRANVLKHIKPLYEQILTQQAKDLGLAKLKPWDTSYNPATTLPLGIAPVKNQLDNAQKLFAKLSPTLEKHFINMRRLDLIDLENRPYKRPGAYCIDFSDSGQVAILCNSTGNADDVRTLCHEMGHAFQNWESNAVIDAVELQSGTADLAEVYSLSMEFLTLPYIDISFDNKNATKYARGIWYQAIYLLCYCCVVDEFQHYVYDNPQLTTAQRDKEWINIQNKYLPGIDWTGLEKYRSLRWHRQQHIFTAPFYYIDYALATTAAMQIALEAEKDHEQALNKFLAMCKLGGTKSFVTAIESVGLRSPFNEKLIIDLAKIAQKNLL